MANKKEITAIEAARKLGMDRVLRAEVREQIRISLAKPARFIDARFYSDQIGKMLERLVGSPV